MSGISCPECNLYFGDGEGHMEMHTQREQEADVLYESAVVNRQQYELALSAEELIKEYMGGYASDDEYLHFCRSAGFYDGLDDCFKGRPNRPPGSVYLMSRDGVAVLQEGYGVGFAMGKRLRG